MKALKDVPLKEEALRADTPTARCREVRLMDGPSNSSFWTNSPTVFRALRGGTGYSLTHTAVNQTGSTPSSLLVESCRVNKSPIKFSQVL